MSKHIFNKNWLFITLVSILFTQVGISQTSKNPGIVLVSVSITAQANPGLATKSRTVFLRPMLRF